MIGANKLVVNIVAKNSYEKTAWAGNGRQPALAEYLKDILVPVENSPPPLSIQNENPQSHSIL